MRREEFMRQLEMLLSDISEEEKQEALSYYRSYFEDAGEENEERILRELESPEKVAATIKADLRMEPGTEGAYQQGMNGNYGKGRSREEDRVVKIVVIAIAAVLTSPIWGGILLGIFGTVFGLAIGFIATAFSLYVCGGVLFGIGIGQLVAGSAAVGFGLLGASMFVLGLAILMTVFCVWVCGKGVPWLCDTVRKLWRKIFPGKEQA